MLQLHSVFDCRQGPIDFSSGSITVCEGKVHKRISSVAGATVPRPFKSLFHCLIPCSIALHLFLVRLLLNTRLFKAIGACTILYDTDLQRGRAVTSMFRDVTVEIYARFQSLSLLSMAKQLDSREDIVRIIVTEVVDSVFGFLPSQVLRDSEPTARASVAC